MDAKKTIVIVLLISLCVIVGVGYRVDVKGQILEFSLGYSHDIHLMLPKEVSP